MHKPLVMEKIGYTILHYAVAPAAGDASVPVLLFVPPAQRKTFLIAPHSLSRSLTDRLYIYRL